MSLKSKPYYWVECDECGANAQDDSDFAAWADQAEAFDHALGGGYTDFEGRWLCEKCGPACCPECQNRAPGPVEHEHMCADCWDGPDATDEAGQSDG